MTHLYGFKLFFFKRFIYFENNFHNLFKNAFKCFYFLISDCLVLLLLVLSFLNRLILSPWAFNLTVLHMGLVINPFYLFMICCDWIPIYDCSHHDLIFRIDCNCSLVLMNSLNLKYNSRLKNKRVRNKVQSWYIKW